MNSVIICEGYTDSKLLQSYMQNVHGWNIDGESSFRHKTQKAMKLKKNDNNLLTIMPSGGCQELSNALQTVLKQNKQSQPDKSDAITQIAIITDRDTENTEANFVNEIKKTLQANHATFTETDTIVNNRWIKLRIETRTGIQLTFELMLMIIPFTETGAMETFLLNAISANDKYEAEIIKKGKDFVNNADPQKRHLFQRSYKLKAELCAYFSIRNPLEDFTGLSLIPWEEYPNIQKDFTHLGELGTEIQI